MSNELLLRILAYIWTAFGVSWVGFSLVWKAPGGAVREGRGAATAVLGVAFILLFLDRHKIPPGLLLLYGLACASSALYWSSSPMKAAQSREFRWYRALRLVILGATFALLFWDATAVGFLGRKFLPPTIIVGSVGFSLALIGMAVSLWARVELGQYWSDRVILQTDHQLIRTGPYAYMRHPIYSGVLLGVLGTALVLGQWRGLLALVVLLINYWIKAKKEEQILSSRFSHEFREHESRAGFLFPRLRPRA
jgi:protein-S-isoprenylcysteine O-methyltransferase Ste14